MIVGVVGVVGVVVVVVAGLNGASILTNEIASILTIERNSIKFDQRNQSYMMVVHVHGAVHDGRT